MNVFLNNLRELDGIRELSCNKNLYRLVSVIVIIAVVGTPHGVPLIACFVGSQWEESRSIKSTISLYVIVHYYRVRG